MSHRATCAVPPRSLSWGLVVCAHAACNMSCSMRTIHIPLTLTNKPRALSCLCACRRPYSSNHSADDLNNSPRLHASRFHRRGKPLEPTGLSTDTPTFSKVGILPPPSPPPLLTTQNPGIKQCAARSSVRGDVRGRGPGGRVGAPRPVSDPNFFDSCRILSQSQTFTRHRT